MSRFFPALRLPGLFAVLVTVGATSVRAQWESQTFTLKSGWNAIYMNVDAGYTNIDTLVGGFTNGNTSIRGVPIQAIWRWNRPSVAGQFNQRPSLPIASSSEWTTWYRNSADLNSLTALTGNAGYLVQLPEMPVDQVYTWTIVGRPVPPSYGWSQSGLNLVGFSTPTQNPPTFQQFFSPVGEFGFDQLIWSYWGGSLSNNPISSLDLDMSLEPVNRGQAQWIAFGTSKPFAGPYETVLTSSRGLDFGDNDSMVSFHLRNTTDYPQTIHLRWLSSLPDPVTGNKPALPPLILRGPISDSAHILHQSIPLTANLDRQIAVLTPQGQSGFDSQIVLGLNRTAMKSDTHSTFAGILQVVDEGGLMQVDIPVSATQGNTAGLWVGNATITHVQPDIPLFYLANQAADAQAVLTRFQLTNAPGDVPAILAQSGITNASLSFTGGKPNFVQDLPSLLSAYNLKLAKDFLINTNSDRVLTNYSINRNTWRIAEQTGTSGKYLFAGQLAQTNTSVVRPFTLRLIRHEDAQGNSKLLQRVYVGPDKANPTNVILATRQSSLDPTQLSSARRISAAHLPFTSDKPPTDSGWMGINASAGQQYTVDVPFDNQACNPFLHTYHPDHDNLNPTFSAPQPRGTESFDIRREINLGYTPASMDSFEAMILGGYSGDYSETITLFGQDNSSRSYRVSGRYALTRISTINTLH